MIDKIETVADAAAQAGTAEQRARYRASDEERLGRLRLAIGR